MSLCYESEKWLIITLASVAVSLTVGLITLVGEGNGQEGLPRCPNGYHRSISGDCRPGEEGSQEINRTKEAEEDAISSRLVDMDIQIESDEKLLNYCAEHADRPNPIQDLVDKAILSIDRNGQTCKDIRIEYETLQQQRIELQEEMNKLLFIN